MRQQLPSGAFLTDIPFTDEMREEIDQLSRQGMSNAAILVIISTKYNCSVTWQPIDNDLYLSYDPFTEYGTPPILPSPEYSNIVEGSLVVDGTVEEEDQHIAHLKKRVDDAYREVKAFMAKYPFPVEGTIVKDASEFTCAVCHYTYVKGQTDEAAIEETNRHWPGTSMEECGVVCDTCWQRMKPDQQNAVHAAYDFVAGMNRLQLTAGHAQDEFEASTASLLNMAKGENEHA